MDVAGARALTDRIEQQQHWEQAEAVRDGRQPACDPDADELTSLRDGIRVYGTRRTTTYAGGVSRLVTQVFCKRLVDGWWEGHVVEDEEAAS